MKYPYIIIYLISSTLISYQVSARTKLVALPDRESTLVRLDHPVYTLVQEERVLTLHKGINKVDFSWKGVRIDANSIRIKILQHPKETQLINVSYPPNAQALVWDIFSRKAQQERIRISYLLANIDRVITYEANTGMTEASLDLASFMVLRNFSGESFDSALFQLNYGQGFKKSINDGETKRMLFFEANDLDFRKIFTFNAGKHSWEPAKQNTNVGIPVTYELENIKTNNLGQHALWGGKVRLYQDDGNNSSIFLGEDETRFTPVGKKMKLYIGDSRDLVVTQRKTRQKRTNVRRNRKNNIILYDSSEAMQLEIENFKDQSATIRIIEPMTGEWEINRSSHQYERKHSKELVFEMVIPAKSKEILKYSYNIKNIRP